MSLRIRKRAAMGLESDDGAIQPANTGTYS